MAVRSTDGAAVILAGGASSRFGSDKTRARLWGTELLGHVVTAVQPLVDEVVVIGPWAPPGVRHEREPEPGRGPLAAVAFGLRQVAAERVLVLGGDHPRLAPQLLAFLLDLADEPLARLRGAEAPHDTQPRTSPGAHLADLDGVADGDDEEIVRAPDAVVPERAGRPEPLVACYRRSVAPVAEGVVVAGGRSMRSLLEQLIVRTVPESEWRRLDPGGLSFDDIDRPEDLAVMASPAASAPEREQRERAADRHLGE